MDSFIREEIQEKKIPTTNNQQFLLDSFKNELYDIYKNYHLHHIIHEEILKYVSQDDYLKKKINKLKFCLIQNAKYDGDHERYDNISLGINYRYFSGVEPWSVLVFELEKVPADGLCGFHSGDLTLQEIIDYLNKNKNNWKIQKFFFDYNIDFINHELNNNNALNDFFHKETQFQSIKELSLAYKPSYVDSEETKEYSIKYNEITKKENLYLLENFNKAFIELIFKKRIWIEHGILKFYIKKIKKKTSIIYSDKLIPMEKFSPIDYKLIYIYCGNEAMNIKNLYNKIINNEIANIFYNGYNHFDQLKYIRTIPGSTIFPYLQSLK